MASENKIVQNFNVQSDLVATNIDNKNSEDEENFDQQEFIKKSEENQKKKDEVFEGFKKDLEEAQNILENAKNILETKHISNDEQIKPEAKKRRDLDVETGGLESENSKSGEVIGLENELEQIASQDVWDNRAEELLKENGKAGQKVTLVQSLIHRKKQEKKHLESAEKSAAHHDKKQENGIGFVGKLNKKEAKSDLENNNIGR